MSTILITNNHFRINAQSSITVSLTNMSVENRPRPNFSIRIYSNSFSIPYLGTTHFENTLLIIHAAQTITVKSFIASNCIHEMPVNTKWQINTAFNGLVLPHTLNTAI